MEEGSRSVECASCAQPASKEYTVVFDTGRILEDITLCEVCHADLDRTDFIEIKSGPVLLRGGGCEDEDQ